MTPPLVVIDADVLGRQRTGDETYVAGLLAGLSADERDGLRLAAVTRRPDLVPAGIEPVELEARSQILRMAVTLPRLLRHNRVDFAEIRGDSRERAESIRRFNENENCKVFVCSLMAGGVGIDLTSASVVIHYDRWWNAAREDQATDRVHRWGQRRGVQVFKLITRGTLEEKIDKMISAKGDLMNSIVDVDAGSFKRFDRDELIELLTGARQAALAAVS